MDNSSNIDLLWVLVCGFLVFMMQLGFALVETGMVRSKNTINVAMKNLIDTVFGIMFFWLLGFGLMFGADHAGLFGGTHFLIDGKDFKQDAFFFFQAMFAATAVTIVSGAVAERMKFSGYIVVAIIVTALIYPLFGHWSWGDGGWLKEMGFIDFAGSTVVHSVGAWVGLAGAIVLGPRLGKFRHGKIHHFSRSNHNFIVFGVFILFFAWFGFNAGSLLEFNESAALILLNTLIAGAFGGFGGWVISLIYKDKVGVEIFSFGIVAGLVGITAGCAEFNTTTSAFVGFISAIIMHFSDQFLANKLRVDDPLSVVSIHGFAGVWGTLAVGLFANLPDGMTRGSLVLVQVIGIGSAFLFAFGLGLILFYGLYLSKLLRVSKKHEVKGLNVSEHNAKLPWVDTIESIITIMRTGNIKTRIYEEKGTEVGLVAKFFNYLLDILRKKHIQLNDTNKELKKKAEIDPLTKLLNRRALMEKISMRNLYNNNLSVAMIDIDKFKSINDTFGHGVGDSVLKELALLVERNVRDNDIFARWGGEEFVLVLNTKDLQMAESISDKIRLEVQKCKFSTVKNITISIGVSSPVNDQQTFDELLELADKALYHAKEGGRNRVCSW